MSPQKSPLGIAFLWAAAKNIHPDLNLRALRARIRSVIASHKAKPVLNALLAQSQHAVLAQELNERPETLGFVQWPYIHAGWLLKQRFEALSQHLQAMQSDMRALSVDATGSVEVADLSQVSPDLRLIVDRAPWCLREGSLVFNQFLGDERMMSLAFSFAWCDGERVVYVGSLQGSNVDSALAKYKDIAKNLHGMRSRDFLIKSFQILMNHLEVKKILCIQESQRHHRHEYFGPTKIQDLHLNYDSIWLEHAGELTPDGFWSLPSLPIIRPLEEIAAKNRALYRRRYQMLNNLSADIQSRFNKQLQSIKPAHLAPQDMTIAIHQPLIPKTT